MFCQVNADTGSLATPSTDNSNLQPKPYIVPAFPAVYTGAILTPSVPSFTLETSMTIIGYEQRSE